MEKFIISLGVCSLLMSAVALLYIILSKTLKNVQSSKWRYYSWILIFIGFITPFKPSFGESAVTVDAERINGYVEVGEKYVVGINGSLLMMIWGLGFILSIGAAFFKQRAFMKSVKRLEKPVSATVLRKLNSLTVELEVFADVKAVTVGEVSSPMVTGVFKPILILPDRKFSDEELHLILKHELVHLRRHDLFIKTFMTLCRAVHWFNPLVGFFMKNAEREGELYCDETVMRDESEERKKLYCQSILNTVSAENKMSARLVPAISSNFFFDKKGLKHRMKMILSFDKKYKLSIVCGLVLALVVCTGTVLAFSGEGGRDDDNFATTTFANTAMLAETTTFAVVTDDIVTTAFTTVVSENIVTTFTATVYEDFTEYSVVPQYDGESGDNVDAEAEISR